ncbi:unnamed protein product [Colias eurytheme]|nr:unnamed protein product [Colias eurytheme]
MDGLSELSLKQICCTCLSTDRKLFQLCKINDGVNYLYYLLSSDPEAYSRGFLQDIVNLHVCWECRAVIKKQISFKKQACLSQKKLSLMTNGFIAINILGKSLSQLTKFHQNTCTHVFNSDDSTDNYIICSPDIFLKKEADFDTIDRLEDCENYSEKKSLNNQFDNTIINSTDETISGDVRNVDIISSQDRIKIEDTNKCLNETDDIEEDISTFHLISANLISSDKESKECYIQIKASEHEIESLKEKKKLNRSYIEAYNRCDLCVQVFRTANIVEKHYYKLHTNKPDFEKCSQCFQYFKTTRLKVHKNEHSKYYKCNLCNEDLFNKNVLYWHLMSFHGIKIKRTPVTKNPGSRPRLSKPLRDKPTALGYKCPQCSQYFESSNMRYKHILQQHREGHRCSKCGKAFLYKSNLKKHERVHAGIPKEQCAQCGKFIRADVMYTHVQIHSERESYECALCDKKFVSRATYDNHLKYTKAHAKDKIILRFICDTCGKGFRSKVDIRDHIHSQHLGKTQHKCTICNKLFSTRSSIKRHVKTLHDGMPATPKNKVCQICGKTFGTNKSLYEHQLIHSGDRPLSCNVCGVTFRQNASLYTHKKRVHKIIFPKAKILKPIDYIDT